METAKKMILVDQRWLDHLMRRKEDANWKRPIDHTAKSKLHRQMKSDLAEDETADDLKVKQCNQHLTRFLNTKREQQQSVGEEGQEEECIKTSADLPRQTKTVKRKKALQSLSSLVLRPKRVRNLPKRLSWEEW
jgi:hypothetical protein